MSAAPRITVITVVKNGADRLEETIRSVINQKAVANIEHLIVDGGSTDGTVEIIRKYADHISWWVSEPDGGVYDAMNKGWAAAPDDGFVLFMGAGDRIVSLPDMNRFQYHDVLCGSVRMGEERLFTPRSGFHLKLYNSLHHQALLISKRLHPAPPFNVRYRLYADFDFNQRLKKSGAAFVRAADFVAYACPGGMSDQPCFPESLRVIVANYGFLWAAFAFAGYCAMKLFPVLRRLRPVQKVRRKGP